MKPSRKKSKTRRTKPAKAKSKSSLRAAKSAAPGFTARAMDAPAAALDAAPPWDREVDDSNVPGLNRPATNAFERHLALDHAVATIWITEDIGMIRRVESGGRFLWVMWRRTTLPPG